jgi:hypothetical protein
MRKKLSLDPELLRVESFETQEGGWARGTVHAQQSDQYSVCYSCGGTCGAIPALPRREGGTVREDWTQPNCATRDYCCV